jgi:RNA polymerase sigma factor (sigma-70 family)
MSGADGLAGTLFERHARSLRQYLRAVTGRPDLADDLAQDVFVRVVQSAGAYEPRQRDRAWLFRIARNAAIDHHRRAAVRPRSDEKRQEPVVPPVQALRSALCQASRSLSGGVGKPARDEGVRPHRHWHSFRHPLGTVRS